MYFLNWTVQVKARCCVVFVSKGQKLSTCWNYNPETIPANLPSLSFWLIPVSEKERVCPRAPLPGPLWPSEKDERLGGVGAVELRGRYCCLVSSCSLLWVELWESRRLRCPRLPIARYSGPSSESPSQESAASGWSKEGEGDPIRETEGMDPEQGGDVGPRSSSADLDTNTQGCSWLPAGEVVSATQRRDFTKQTLPKKVHTQVKVFIFHLSMKGTETNLDLETLN